MEEESGIGGKMVRTKTEEKLEPDNRELEAEGSHAAAMSDQANECQEEERAEASTQIAERENCGDAHSLGALDGLTKPVATESGGFGFSQARAWYEEPEWDGELSEAEAETEFGSREPES